MGIYRAPKLVYTCNETGYNERSIVLTPDNLKELYGRRYEKWEEYCYKLVQNDLN